MIWRITMFGELALRRGEVVVTRFESARAASLLAYLALHSRFPVPREELLEILWPEESDLERVRQRLRQALYSLRCALEPAGIPPASVLYTDRRTAQLRPSAFSCDVLEFEQAVKSRRVEQARTLYAGELLPGCFDEWIVDERNRLEALYQDLPDAPVGPPAHEPATVRDTLPGRRVALPAYSRPFFGREAEGESVFRALDTYRLVTLTGPGGVGKTRLAVECARRVSDHFDTFAFVPLETCASPSCITHEILSALHIQPGPSDSMEQIALAIRGNGDSRTLLVLDNLEQLVSNEANQTLSSLIASDPGLTLLMTSRRLIGLSEEFEIALQPLPAIGEDDRPNPGEEPAAMALFLDRARAVRPTFHVTEANRRLLSQLCNALEGLPLSLELAASRIRAYSPGEMLASLDDRFNLLRRPGAASRGHDRASSLHSALEWSWRLLSPAEQAILSRLSVFRGGFTASLAAEVCEAPNARDHLENLVLHSLLHSHAPEEAAEVRFGMLDSVRELVAQKLDPVDRDIASEAHQRALLRMATRIRGGSHSAAFAEAENLRCAVESAIESGSANLALELIVALDESWLALMGPERALDLSLQALCQARGSTPIRAEATALASHLALLTRDRQTARDLAAEALAQAGEDAESRALALLAVARAGMESNDGTTAAANDALMEALRIAVSPRTRARAMRHLGIIATRMREFAESNRLLAEATSLFGQIGDRHGVLYATDSLANNALHWQDLSRALRLYNRVRELAEELDNRLYVAKVYQNLATVYARQGRWHEALETGRECIVRNRQLGNVYMLGHALWNYVEPLCRVGRAREAARLMGFAQALWLARYDPLSADDELYLQDQLAAAAEQIGSEEAKRARMHGAADRLEEAIDAALAAWPAEIVPA